MKTNTDVQKLVQNYNIKEIFILPIIVDRKYIKIKI